MAFWSGERILQNKFLIEGFDGARQDCNGYNLSIGNTYFKTSEEFVNTQKNTEIKDGESFVIAPGQFAFLITKEVVHIPENAMAFISMKTGVKFQGLINVSGFHVDPGYNGKLVYSVYNASPNNIQLTCGDPLFKIWFCDLDQKSSAPFLFSKKAPKTITNELVHGMSREVYSLQGLSEKLRTLDQKIDLKFAEQKPVIENLATYYRTIQTALTTAGILAIVSLIISVGILAARQLAPDVMPPHAAGTAAHSKPKDTP